MRAATAAVTAMLVTVTMTALAACGGGGGGHTPADQLATCDQARKDATSYGYTVQLNLDQARQAAQLTATAPFAVQNMATANVSIRQWRLSTAQLAGKDITPDLKKAMDTLVARLKPAEDATADAFGEPPVLDSSIEVYQHTLDTLCP